MITDLRDVRLVVTSDIHLGSFFCHPRRSLERFFSFASERGYDICINGDGIDVLHTSLDRIANETSQMLARLRQILRDDAIVYYTIGNHDVILEHYLQDWGMLRLVPFLNVTSGTKRIRIEHGHLYDSFFMKHQELQEFLARAAMYPLRLYPDGYRWHKAPKALLHRSTTLPLAGPLMKRLLEPDDGLRIPGQNPAFVRAADELSRRGFDVVIFGHTHHPGTFPLSADRTYINTGSWFREPHYVSIENGEIELRRWQG